MSGVGEEVVAGGQAQRAISPNAQPSRMIHDRVESFHRMRESNGRFGTVWHSNGDQRTGGDDRCEMVRGFRLRPGWSGGHYFASALWFCSQPANSVATSSAMAPPRSSRPRIAWRS